MDRKYKKILILFIVLFCVTSCHKKNKKVKTRKYPASTAIAVKKDAPIFLENIGHITPLIKIEVRSRVEGELTKVHFKEGDEVKKGDLLFTIDPRNYEADLNKAKATYDETLANLDLAKDKVKRSRPLYKSDYISQFDFETYLTQVLTYKAKLEQNKAVIEEAETNLSYCYIYSPVDGKTSILNIDEGNLIAKEDKTALITINQLKPIYVQFALPQKYLPTIKKYAVGNNLKVNLAFESFKDECIQGDLSLLNNEVNTSTGMINFRATFPNGDKKLWPGQFVRVRLILKIEKDAILIPYQAIQITPQGPQVFVVSRYNRVTLRKVILSQREDDCIVISSGIKEDEKVVTEGQINLIDGSYITQTKEI